MLPFRIDYTCISWALQVMQALQPTAPWIRTYPITAYTVCKVAQDNPIYPGDKDKSVALLLAMAYHESRFLAHPPSSPSLCMIQLSPIWITKDSTLYECLSKGSDLLRDSIEKYGDIRAYTHGLPYPKHDDAGALRLRLAKKIWKQHQEDQLGTN